MNTGMGKIQNTALGPEKWKFAKTVIRIVCLYYRLRSIFFRRFMQFSQ